jgi:hypothetical protein
MYSVIINAVLPIGFVLEGQKCDAFKTWLDSRLITKTKSNLGLLSQFIFRKKSQPHMVKNNHQFCQMKSKYLELNLVPAMRLTGIQSYNIYQLCHSDSQQYTNLTAPNLCVTLTWISTQLQLNRTMYGKFEFIIWNQFSASFSHQPKYVAIICVIKVFVDWCFTAPQCHSKWV